MHTERQLIINPAIPYVQVSLMLFMICPAVHQPSSGGSCGDEDSWCSECAGAMERGGVAELKGVTLGTTLKGVDEGVTPTDDVLTGLAAAVLAVTQGDGGVAEGTKGLALALRVDSTAVGLVDKAEVGGSGVLLETEPWETGIGVSVRADFVGGQVAREGVIVMGVVA